MLSRLLSRLYKYLNILSDYPFSDVNGITVNKNSSCVESFLAFTVTYTKVLQSIYGLLSRTAKRYRNMLLRYPVYS